MFCWPLHLLQAFKRIRQPDWWTPKRDHQLYVRQTHIIAHAFYCAAFQFETVLETRIQVPRRAAETEHRLFFLGFVLNEAEKVTKLVWIFSASVCGE